MRLRVFGGLTSSHKLAMSRAWLFLIECTKLKINVVIDCGSRESRMAGIYPISLPELLGSSSLVSAIVQKPQRKSKCAVVNQDLEYQR